MYAHDGKPREVITWMKLALHENIFAYRGDFRRSFRHLGDLRSLLPSSVNVMACTATATATVFKEVSEVLSLHRPVVIADNPDRQNIVYIQYLC